jgi:hypothetical protein
VVQYLVSSHHVDVDLRDRRDRTPLHCAAFSGELNVVEYLITQGAAVNARDNKDMTPLHFAAATMDILRLYNGWSHTKLTSISKTIKVRLHYIKRLSMAMDDLKLYNGW